MTIKPMERAMVPTGLSIELPSGWEFRISARSGLSIKNGISMVNGIGIIDADFRDEMHVLVINLGQKDFVVEPGMRIAQALAAPVEKIEWEEVQALSKTDRKGGFGSTGTS